LFRHDSILLVIDLGIPTLSFPEKRIGSRLSDTSLPRGQSKRHERTVPAPEAEGLGVRAALRENSSFRP
jgi:hypothetical protein